MTNEQMKTLAAEESKKHKFRKERKTTWNKELRQEETETKDVPVKKVVVIMPKHAAYPDPTTEQMEAIREYAANHKQSIYEFDHESEDSGKKDSGKNK